MTIFPVYHVMMLCYALVMLTDASFRSLHALRLVEMTKGEGVEMTKG